MPEMTFELQWPDGSRQTYYSPSLVMHDYLTTGASYTVADLVNLSSTALAEASARVRAKFGFACTSAGAAMDQIQRTAGKFPSGSLIKVAAMHPPMEKV